MVLVELANCRRELMGVIWQIGQVLRSTLEQIGLSALPIHSPRCFQA